MIADMDDPSMEDLLLVGPSLEDTLSEDSPTEIIS